MNDGHTITREMVEQALGSNPYWTTLPALRRGFDGMTPEEALAAVTRFWAGEKARVLNMIVSDLAKCEANMSRYGAAYGHDYVVGMWSVIERQLATKDWQYKSGPVSIWKAMYRLASKKTQQDLPAPASAAVPDRMARLAEAQRRLAEERAV